MQKHLYGSYFPSSSPSSYASPYASITQECKGCLPAMSTTQIMWGKASKYNTTFHKKYSCNEVKCHKTFSSFSKLTFLLFKIHFYGPCANTLARIREESGGATWSELSHVLGNFHFVLLTYGNNLFLLLITTIYLLQISK